MKKVFLTLLALAILALPSFGQASSPNCNINFSWNDVAASASFYNGGQVQCAYFVLTYQVTGFIAVSIQFESATGIAGAPGSFGAFTGTLVSGSNPSTSVSCGTPSNCTAVFSGVVGWFRVRFVSHTGNGTIQGTLQGYKA